LNAKGDKVQALTAWAANRFKPFAMVAQILAVNPRASLEMIEAGRAKVLRRQVGFAGGAMRSWWNLYRRPLQVEAAVGLCGCIPEMEQGTVDEVIRQICEIRHDFATLSAAAKGVYIRGDDPERFRRWHELTLERYYRREFLPMLQAMLSESTDPLPEMAEWMRRPEIVFAFTVAMPCVLEFQRTAWELYAQARLESVEALEKLARIDPTVIYEPRVATWLSRMQLEHPEQYRLIAQAALEGSTREFSIGDMKYVLGGLILFLAEKWEGLITGTAVWEHVSRNLPPVASSELRAWLKTQQRTAKRVTGRCRLFPADVVSLFHAVAQDSNVGRVDPDFVGKPDSISKRLRRNAQLWEDLRQTDKRRAA
jgi:hypothetical protein